MGDTKPNTGTHTATDRAWWDVSQDRNEGAPRIVNITCAVVRGQKRDFVNVYGVDERSKVWQWDAKDGRWRPNIIEPRRDTNRGGDWRDDGRR